MSESAVALRKGEPSDLRAIIDIAASRPTHFVPAAFPLIATDFLRHQTVLAAAKGRVVAFLVWRAEDQEIELLWMAVAPDFEREGVGTRLVKYVLNAASQKTHIYLLTATPDSKISGTNFSGTGFLNTIQFFKHLGFTEEKIFPGYWGPFNHALQLGLRWNHDPAHCCP